VRKERKNTADQEERGNAALFILFPCADDSRRKEKKGCGNGEKKEGAVGLA